MSGLLALLDDVAAIAKVAAASVDDIAAAAAKAGAKAAGVVIDDAAVTPKYVQGLAPARELPIVWRIARGSLFNKMVILLPAALLLNYFAPWLIIPLLMVGGSYLCFEGAEKVLHALFPHPPETVQEDFTPKDPTKLEAERVAGAIKTDFILSAEVMAIALSAIPDFPLWLEAISLAVVAIGITIAVYGAVALLVKMDDVGLAMARSGRLGFTRSFGMGLVKAMPVVMTILSVVGTAAMLWVGGSIVLHGLDVLGWPWLYSSIAGIAATAAAAVPPGLAAAVRWMVTAGLDGVFGLAWGLVMIPLATWVIRPVLDAVRR